MKRIPHPWWHFFLTSLHKVVSWPGYCEAYEVQSYCSKCKVLYKIMHDEHLDRAKEVKL
jgi:hypothetical protein